MNIRNQRKKNPNTRPLVIWLLPFFLTNGCESPFPPETLVDRPRLLAVRADPPEVTLTDVVRLDALVADPKDKDRNFKVTWAICIFKFEDSAVDIPCPGSDSYLLAGNQLHADFSVPAWIEWLEEQGIDTDSILKQLDVERLPWILVGFKLEADGLSMRAVKRIKLRLDDQQPPNHNPVITGILINGEEPGEPLPSLQANQTHTLQPLFAQDSREWYLSDDREETRQEDHLFSWFSTCGSFSNRRTIVDVDNQGNLLQINQWKIDAKPSGDSCTLWIVLRDGRYGVDWAVYHFRLNIS